MSSPLHLSPEPSAWVRRWSHPVRQGARVLDVACGSGRHVRWFASQGAAVTGIDRDQTATEALRGLATIVIADLENGPWPLPDARFDVVVCTNYLWRPLLPVLVASVAPGGMLVYETFGLGQERFGRPANPDFLLRPGELLIACSGLRIRGYEEGLAKQPERCVQRVAAVREVHGPGLDRPWPLPDSDPSAPLPG